MINKLARGFDAVLMRYLPQLLCFEVKPSSLYRKSDYIRLLVNSSVLNAYAEGMSNVSNKVGAGVPNADTALLYFKTIDTYDNFALFIHPWTIAMRTSLPVGQDSSCLHTPMRPLRSNMRAHPGSPNQVLAHQGAVEDRGLLICLIVIGFVMPTRVIVRPPVLQD
jgi:hypothetical protein